MDPQQELPPDAVLRLDLRRSLDEVPEEILALLPLFDGRRTLTQWMKASRLPPATAREVVDTLRRRKVIAERPELERDDGPELADWLAAGTLAGRKPMRRQLVMAVAGLLVTVGIAAVAIGSRKTTSPPVAAMAAAVAVPAPVVEPIAPVAVVEPAAPVAVAEPVVTAAPPTAVITPPAPPEIPPPPGVAPPADARALTDEGKRLYARGKIKQAIAILEKAAAADSANDDALVALAKCHLDQGANGKALAESRQAAKVNERNADAYIVIGTVQQQNGHGAEAKAAFKKYVELSPKGEFAAEIRSIMKTL